MARTPTNRVGALLAVLALPGCLITTSEPDDGVVVRRTSSGVVVIDWTIEGSKEPARCALSDAEAISVALSTSAGNYVGTFEQSCDAFGTSIDLYPDDYVGDAVLIDTFGDELTTPVNLGHFRIYSDEALLVPVDFPVDSFY
jgi:hypothetical protein